MTIDDELILELVKPDRHGKVGEKALIVKIVGTPKIEYMLEEPTFCWEYYERRVQSESGRVRVTMTPDITVKVLDKIPKPIAIELENDVHWDFGESLRQVKKYKRKFDDTRVIIPEEFERFAPLYKNEGFRVYLWTATRVWQCMICGELTYKEEPIQPKCEECNKRTEHRLVGLEDVDIEEYS